MMDAVQFGAAYRFRDGARARAFLQEKQEAGVDAEHSLQVWIDTKKHLQLDHFVFTSEGYDGALKLYRFSRDLKKAFNAPEKNRLPAYEAQRLERVAREAERTLMWRILETAERMDIEA